MQSKHSYALLHMIATDLDIKVDQIADFELVFADAQEAAFIGLHKEFLVSARLDNLVSSLPGMHAIVEAGNQDNAEVSVLLLFDHEEIGSQSA